MSTKKKQDKAMNEQSLNTFTGIVDNSISNMNADIQNKLDIKLSTLKDDLKQEFCESLNSLKTDILERLLADNKKLRKRLSWIEEEIENLYAHRLLYRETTSIHMLNKIVGEPISPNEVEACHRIGGDDLAKREQLFVLAIVKEVMISKGIEFTWAKLIYTKNLGSLKTQSSSSMTT